MKPRPMCEQFYVNQEQFGLAIRAVVNGEVWFVPEDETNSMYREYLAWVAEGNTANKWVG